jgi:photosynthetic reaction center cytochrome c subunit
MSRPIRNITVALGLAATLLMTGCWERPPMESKQLGYRGTGMVDITNPRIDGPVLAAQTIPEVVPAAGDDVPILAGDIYENVQVLGDLNVAEFARIMVAITAWVSPEQSCLYCHVEGESMAADTLYTKVVARRMIEMTRDVNTDWTAHVAETGVTCYTCHRGKPVPDMIWFADPGPKTARGLAGNRAGQNAAAPAVGLASLPFDPFTPFLLQDRRIGVGSAAALPDGSNTADIMQTEWTYGLMIHMSNSLGLNCTGCHNSRHFGSWEESTPQRVSAWHGIRMARSLNTDYIEPMTPIFPENRLGPMGDVGKVYCATCHQGVQKPLNGISMLADYPELRAPAATAEPLAEPEVEAETGQETGAVTETIAAVR